MRNGGAACKLPVPVKEASPDHQLNPDFINHTHFLALEQVPRLHTYLAGCQSHPNPSHLHMHTPPFLTRPCFSGTQF